VAVDPGDRERMRAQRREGHPNHRGDQQALPLIGSGTGGLSRDASRSAIDAGPAEFDRSSQGLEVRVVTYDASDPR